MTNSGQVFGKDMCMAGSVFEWGPFMTLIIRNMKRFRDVSIELWEQGKFCLLRQFGVHRSFFRYLVRDLFARTVS
jgi:hypothetical protein